MGLSCLTAMCYQRKDPLDGELKDGSCCETRDCKKTKVISGMVFKNMESKILPDAQQRQSLRVPEDGRALRVEACADL